uniref:Myosin motor domain-containing protein n=1 Tax=Spongospora subterranea TaxID=70186 RepID=A0A0H5QSS5_9EUKA|eukprot:CRZ04631.1 hypothetical protein [Spongospora subterranea]
MDHDEVVNAKSGCVVGRCYWLPHPKLVWVPGRYLGSGRFRLSDGSVLDDRRQHNLELVLDDDTDDDNDLSLILPLKFPERTLVHHLRKRYFRDLVHAWVGPVLLVINPRRPLPDYTARVTDRIDEYVKLNIPHPFSLISKAVHNMVTRKKSQWIVASGPECSGQQHFNMTIIQFFAQYSGLASNDTIGETVAVNALKALEILKSFTEISNEEFRSAIITTKLWFNQSAELRRTVNK